MSKPKKVIAAGLWGLVLVGIVGIVLIQRAARQRRMITESAATQGVQSGNQPVERRVADFVLLNQDGKQVSLDSLRGRSWIGAFIFTRCQGPCPLLTQNMMDLRAMLADRPLRLVSFTVDPSYDSPAVLKQYALDRSIDLSDWMFLSGDRESIFNVARSMNLAVQPALGNQPILHSTRLVWVDENGYIISTIDGMDKAAVKELAASIK